LMALLLPIVRHFAESNDANTEPDTARTPFPS